MAEKPSKRWPVVGFRVSKRQLMELDEQARREGRSRSAVVDSAVRQYLRRKREEEDEE